MSSFKAMVVLICAAAVALVGCGKGEKLQLGQVKGKVLLDGQPLTQGTVSFTPDQSKGTKGPMATGPLNDKGEFTLTAAGGGTGAVVGHHKVTVAPPFDPGMGSSGDGSAKAPPKDAAKGPQIPQKYVGYATTDLTVEVKAGAQDVTLELKSR
jgi:hypothetical protein